MKQYKRLIAAICLILFVITTINIDVLGSSIQIETKKYSNVTIDDNFTDNKVIVIFTEEESFKFKEYDVSDFEDIGCVEITDLSASATSRMINNVNENVEIKEEYINSNDKNFRRALCLKLEINSKQNVLDIINKLEVNNDYYYVGPDYIVESSAYDPNDNLYSQNINNTSSYWPVNAINLNKAWEYTTGTEQILVGVIDSGIDASHEDLSASIVSELSCEIFDGVITMDSTPTDELGHGTQVAGVIGAIGNNSKGIAGSCWNVGLVSIKVTDSAGQFKMSDVGKAIDFAGETIQILNLSAGIYENYEKYNESLETYLDNFPGLLICAAGNEGVNLDNVSNDYYPACYSLDNLITVGAFSSDMSIWDHSNYGKTSVDIFAPGDNILSTVPNFYCTNKGQLRGCYSCELRFNIKQELTNYVIKGTYTWDYISDNYYSMYGKSPVESQSTTHLNDGYHFSSGTSLATPFVTGVAALVASCNPSLSGSQIKDIIMNNVTMLYDENNVSIFDDYCVSGGIIDAEKAVKAAIKTLSIPVVTLNNSSSSISCNKNILSTATYFNDLNGFYKLDVKYSKYYEFVASYTNNFEMTLYDEDLNEISSSEMGESNNIYHIQYLTEGIYYLRTKYTNSQAYGIIGLVINSINTTSLQNGVNNITLNYLNNISSYQYLNTSGTGMYKISLSGETTTGTIPYPVSSLSIYNDSSRNNLVTRLETSLYELEANTSYNSNNLIVYLENDTTYYIDVLLSNSDLSNLTLNIEKIDDENIIDLFNYAEDVYEEEVIVNQAVTNYGDYFEILDVKQKGSYQISYEHNGTQNEYIYYALYKVIPGNSNQDEVIQLILPEILTTCGETFTWETILDEGLYYIGYYNKLNTSSIKISVKYRFTEYSTTSIISDPDYETPSGSMINIYEKNNSYKSYRGINIVVGFTRILYLDPILDVETRTDYDWYSSDEDIASVSQFGTIFGKRIGTVKIMAVKKSNPSIAYIKTFNIINDTNTGDEEIISTITIGHNTGAGDYKVGLTVQNCPYPSFYLYTWEIISYDETITYIEISAHGTVEVEGYGNAVIKGSNYYYNNEYSVVFNLTFITE